MVKDVARPPTACRAVSAARSNPAHDVNVNDAKVEKPNFKECEFSGKFSVHKSIIHLNFDFFQLACKINGLLYLYFCIDVLLYSRN